MAEISQLSAGIAAVLYASPLCQERPYASATRRRARRRRGRPTASTPITNSRAGGIPAQAARRRRGAALDPEVSLEALVVLLVGELAAHRHPLLVAEACPPGGQALRIDAHQIPPARPVASTPRNSTPNSMFTRWRHKWWCGQGDRHIVCWPRARRSYACSLFYWVWCWEPSSCFLAPPCCRNYFGMLSWTVYCASLASWQSCSRSRRPRSCVYPTATWGSSSGSTAGGRSRKAASSLCTARTVHKPRSSPPGFIHGFWSTSSTTSTPASPRLASPRARSAS